MDGRKRCFLDMVNIAMERERDSGGCWYRPRVLSKPTHKQPHFSDRMFDDNVQTRCVIVAYRGSRVTRPYMFRIRSFA